MNRKFAPIALALAALFAAPAALAQSAGTFTFGMGVHNVDPRSDNGTLNNGVSLNVGNSVRPTFTGEYFVADNLGLELIAAVPFQHNIHAHTATADLGHIGSTRQLPPTFSVNYHFGDVDAAIKPYVGLGVNFTWFYDEKATGALTGADLSLANSWGAAAQAGIDFRVGNAGAVRLNVRKADIDTDVRLNGVEVGTAKIDPLVYGVHYMMTF